MKLGRLLLLAGAALAANQFLKTERGKQLKKTVADKAKGWKDQMGNMNGGRSSLEDSNPAGSSFSGGNGPL